MRKETREDWERRVHRTLEKMTGSLDEAVLAEQFAGDAASSRWHFERAFRSLTGEPFASCVRRLRLERAAYRLQEGEPVLKTALDAGYESAESFCRAFRRAFGLAPSRVSSLPWWRGELPAPNGLHWRPGAPPRWHLSPVAGSAPTDSTRVLELPPQIILTIPGTPDFWQLPALWESFGNMLRKLAEKPTAGSFLTVFSQDTPPLAAPAVLVPETTYSIPGIPGNTLPGGLYAVTTFTGPCEAIGPFWESLRLSFFDSGGWLPDHTRPSLEWYQNTPPEGLPELTVTFLCDPVRSLEQYQ